MTRSLVPKEHRTLWVLGIALLWIVGLGQVVLRSERAAREADRLEASYPEVPYQELIELGQQNDALRAELGEPPRAAELGGAFAAEPAAAPVAPVEAEVRYDATEVHLLSAPQLEAGIVKTREALDFWREQLTHRAQNSGAEAKPDAAPDAEF